MYNIIATSFHWHRIKFPQSENPLLPQVTAKALEIRNSAIVRTEKTHFEDCLDDLFILAFLSNKLENRASNYLMERRAPQSVTPYI